MQTNQIHYHSIIVVKNTRQQYLLYFDHDWQCFLFPNYKKHSNNEDNIISKLSQQFHIEKESIKIQFMTNLVHQKYSHKHQEIRTYEHAFYIAELKSIPMIHTDAFVLDGIDYRWMTIEEMQQNPIIQEKNGDIVGFVKKYCL